MGKRKYLDKIEELFEKSPVVSFSTINRIIKDKKKTEYAKQLVRNLGRQGKIKVLAKGYYTKHDDPSLAVFCFKPAYLGLQSALSMHGLWEQETVPIIITATKARPGKRKILEMNVNIRRISKKYFFGFETYDDGFYLPYSDVEKTLIDLIVFNERISLETMANIRKRIDEKKLKEYLGEYPGAIRKKLMNSLFKSAPRK